MEEINKYGLYSINLTQFLSNPHPKAIEIMKNNIELIDLDIVVFNEGAYELIRDNFDCLNKGQLRCVGYNKNPDVVKLIEDNLDKLDHLKTLKSLSRNPFAIHILEKYPKRIDQITINENSNAIHIAKSLYNFYSTRRSKITLRRKQKRYIKDTQLSKNPAIFELNIDKIINVLIDF